jgi:predicted nuclease with RNAse H fold
MNVYVGIDVACAKRKPLPICFVTHAEGKLKILSPPEEFLELVPRGVGNAEVLNKHPFRVVAEQTARAFQCLIERFGWKIGCIAIDAPAAPPFEGKRISEISLREAGLECIWTPDHSKWVERIARSHEYLSSNGPIARLPGANQIWMLYGFELFEALRKIGVEEIIEVFPYSIVRTLLPSCPHKTTSEGYLLQIEAVAKATHYTRAALEYELRQNVRGTRHDRLDAYMAAWVSSLPRASRQSFGPKLDPNDSIWIPRRSHLISAGP